SPFCPWIEELASSLLLAGCGPSLFCPSAPMTREQMAVFLLVAAGGYHTQECQYLFADVPPSRPFCGAIERIHRPAITAGCRGRLRRRDLLPHRAGHARPEGGFSHRSVRPHVVRSVTPRPKPPPSAAGRSRGRSSRSRRARPARAPARRAGRAARPATARAPK